MYLFDTNHCSAIILGNINVIRRLSEVGENNIATCVIVQGELTFTMKISAQRSKSCSVSRVFRRYSYLQGNGIYSNYLRSIKISFIQSICTQG